MPNPKPQLTGDRSSVYIPAATLEPLKREVVVNAPPKVHAPNFINDVAAGKVELPIIPRVVQRLIQRCATPTSMHARSAKPWRRTRCSAPRC
jgi:hypothetical protein